MELTKSAHTQRNEFRKCKADACTGTERKETMTKAMTNQYKAQMPDRMVAAILISFGCYLPVTLLCKKYPKVGLLMIPKTCAYIWMIVMGLQLLF